MHKCILWTASLYSVVYAELGGLDYFPSIDNYEALRISSC